MIQELRFMKNLKLIAAVLILSSLFLILYRASAYAQTMSNSSYIIRMGNLNSGSGKPTGPSYKVSFTLGQTGANLFGTQF